MASTAIVSTIVLLLLTVGLVLIVWSVIAFIRAIVAPFARQPGGQPVTRYSRDADTDADGMNPGDYYNGPHGYSPMTGYPETQYGSGFDPDADWNHERE